MVTIREAIKEVVTELQRVASAEEVIFTAQISI